MKLLPGQSSSSAAAPRATAGRPPQCFERSYARLEPYLLRAHWLLSGERWPVVTDLVEDRVYSRLITTLLFTLAAVYILRIGLYAAFLWHPLAAGGAQTGILSIVAAPTTVAIEVSATVPLTLAYVSTTDAEGISGVNLTVSAAIVAPGENVWATRYGFRGTLYDLTGLPMGDRYTLPGMPPSLFTTPMLRNAVATTSSTGTAVFSGLAVELALPGAYTVAAANSDGSITRAVGTIQLATSVNSITLVTPPASALPLPARLGDVLPLLAVRVTDMNGNPLAGKRVALLSAPLTSGELSSLGLRPDVLQPRYAALSNSISAPTNSSGIALFTNVVIVGSTLRSVLADFVCDGVRSDAAQLQVTLTDRISISILTQPDAAVQEGLPFVQQPRVQVMRDGAPLVGISVAALPFMQAGVRTQTLVTPASVAEWDMVAGTAATILANLGRRKLLYNFMSNPTDASGTANWTRMGFISHGPAGAYTLTFGCAGLQLAAETSVIAVASSVAAVTLRNASSTSVTICSFPACSYTLGGPYGSVGYTAGIASSKFINASAFRVADGPSGSFASPPSLTISDATGAPLYGKWATPTAVLTSVAGRGILPADVVRIMEYPHAGASVSKISQLSTSAADTNQPSVLQYWAHNIGIGDTAQQVQSSTTGDYGSFLRVVAAPRGVSTSTLSFVVEGVASATIVLTVNNVDTVPSCSYIDWVSDGSASAIVLNSTSLASGASALTSPLSWMAYDSAGAFLALGTSASTLGITDASGFVSLQSPVDGSGSTLRQEWVTYARQNAGGLAYALGNFSASLSGLVPPSDMCALASRIGTAKGCYGVGIVAGLRTFVRSAAVYSTPQPGDVLSQRSFPLGGCYSQSSAPVPIIGNIVSLDWVNPPSTPVQCLADSATPLPQTPTMEATFSSPAVVTPVQGVLTVAIDEDLSVYPAMLGVTARRFDPATANSVIGAPVKTAGDLGTSSMLIGNFSDQALYGVTSAFVKTAFASVGDFIMPFDPVARRYVNIAATPAVLRTQPNTSSAVPRNAAWLQAPSMLVKTSTPATFRFVGYAEGLITPPWTPVACTNPVNVVIMADWAAPNCPSNVSVVAEHPPSSGQYPTAASFPGTTCKNNCGGSNRGKCVCGVCVCAPGWDGASDCSQPFDGDGYTILYANDPMYGGTYGGLPVVDMREQIELAAAAGNNQYYGDVFPRFLFAFVSLVSVASNLTALYAYAAQRQSALPLYSSLASPEQRLGDVINGDILSSAVTGVTFSPPPQATTDAYALFPVLMTCAGVEVADAYFTVVTPSQDRCAATRVPVVSTPILSFGGSVYDSFSGTYVATDFNQPLTTISSTFVIDRRLLLNNVPTGCYRFKYVYAPNGGGSFSARRMSNPLTSSQAVSFGASRPFRVLSPVMSMNVAQLPSMTVPRNVLLPFQPSVSLNIRRRAGAPGPFVDACSLAAANDLNSLSAASVTSRCGAAPFGGQPVYVSAVSLSSAAVIPLYVKNAQVDCTRTNISVTAAGEVHVASFTSVAFPSLTSDPTSISPDAGIQVPAGTYLLRFSALGTTAVSTYTVTVVDTPNLLLTPQAGNVSAASMTRATVGTAITPPINATTLLTSTTAGVPSFGMPQIPVRVALVAGPPNSNAVLGDVGASGITDVSGNVLFTSLVFTAGVSGQYALRLRTDGVTCDPVSHTVLVNVTNPISAVRVADGAAEAASVHSSFAPLRLQRSTAWSLALRACPMYRNGSFAVNASVVARTALASSSSGSAAPVWWSSSNSSSATASCTASLTETRTFIDVGMSVSSGMTDASGCWTVPPVAFTRVSSSVKVALYFTVAGVDSTPMYVQLLTPQDAQSWSLTELQNQLPLPLALTVAPLMANSAHYRPVVRAIVFAGVTVSVVFLWTSGGGYFLTQTASLAQFYTTGDLQFLTIQDATYVVLYVGVLVSMLGLIVGATVRAVGAVGCNKVCSSRCVTGRGVVSPSSKDDAMQSEDADAILWGGHAAEKQVAAVHCTRTHIPHAFAPLQRQDGYLHPSCVRALISVFQQYATAGADTTTVVPRTRASSWLFWLRVTDDVPLPAAEVPTCHFSASDVDRLQNVLLTVHTGMRFRQKASPGIDASQSAERAMPLTCDEFFGVIAYRLRTFGVCTVVADLRNASPARMAALPRPFLARMFCSGETWSLTAEGCELVNAVYADIVEDKRRQVYTPFGVLPLDGAPSMLAIWEPSLAYAWSQLQPGMTLLQWLDMFSARLRWARVRCVRGEAAGAAREIAGVQQTRSRALSIVVHDIGVWAELRAWGFDHRLRASLTDSDGSPAPRLLHAMEGIFRMYAEPTQENASELREAHITELLRSAQLAPLPATTFRALSVSHASCHGDMHSFRNPLAITAGAAQGDAAGADLRLDSDSSDRFVSARRLVEHTLRSSHSPQQDVWAILRAHGVSEQLTYTGQAQKSKKVQLGWDLVSSRLALAARYRTGLMSYLVRTMPDGVEWCVGSQDASAFFVPQRFIIAIVLSIVALGFGTLVVCSLISLLQSYVDGVYNQLLSANSLLQAAVLQSSAAAASAENGQLAAALTWATSGYVQQANDQAATVNTVADALRGTPASSAADTVAAQANNAAALTSRIQLALIAATTAGDPNVLLPPGTIPPDLQAVLTTYAASNPVLAPLAQYGGSIDAASSLAYSLLTSGTANTTVTMAAELQASIGTATAAALVVAWVAVMATLMCTVINFRSMMLSARRGVAPAFTRDVHVAAASKYVGVQLSQSALAFVIIWILMFAVIIVFSFSNVREATATFLRNYILAFLGASLGVSIFNYVLMYYVLSGLGGVRYRKLYMLADVYFTLANMFVGSLWALMRLGYAAPAFIMQLARTDVSPLPEDYYSYDPVTSAYLGMLRQDLQSSHPVTLAFTCELIRVLKQRREQRQMLLLQGAAVMEFDPVTSRSGRALAAVSRGVHAVRTIVHLPLQPLTAKADGQVQEEAARARRSQARNRWWLAFTLIHFPSLRQYRVRTLAASTGGNSAASSESQGGNETAIV